VDDVWESFTVFHERPMGVRDRLFARRKTVSEEFLALKGVTVHLDPGDTVGLIGENGSGKSTLLKCIANILPPSRGTVRTYGRTASMLELGAGFHGDLTGRENVYLNGSILGFSKRFVDKVFDDMVDFAGPQVAESIDNPVRTYSSGMYLRLGFAVSVHLQPDVLIIDEVLAVGDAAFQKQCFDRIHELKRRGVTIAVVSHDLDTVASLCDRGVYLKRGEVIMEGPSVEVVDRYRHDYTAEMGGVGQWSGGSIYGNGDMSLENITLAGVGEHEAAQAGQKLSVSFDAVANVELDNPTFGLIVRANDGTYLYGTNNLWRRMNAGSFRPGQRRRVRFEFSIPLLKGRYVVTVAASRTDGMVVYDWHTDVVAFDVGGAFEQDGVVDLGATISVEGMGADTLANPETPASDAGSQPAPAAGEDGP
jgi:ABC-2 type transport system ATP-binding protein